LKWIPYHEKQKKQKNGRNINISLLSENKKDGDKNENQKNVK